MNFAHYSWLTLALLSCLSPANCAALPKSPFFPSADILSSFEEINKLPGKISSNEDYFPCLSKLIFKLSTGVLTFGKLNAYYTEYLEDKLPILIQLTQEYTKERCDEVGRNCTNYHHKYQIGGLNSSEDHYEYTTWLEGAQSNDVELQFGRNNVSYRFTVPEYQLISTDFLSLETNLKTGEERELSGLVAGIHNSTLGMKLDFRFVNGTYSIFNLDLTLEYGAVTVDVPKVRAREAGREWRNLEPLHSDAAPMVMKLLEGKDESGWTLEERYEQFLEQQINKLLSGQN